jgi:hypothetical protein
MLARKGYPPATCLQVVNEALNQVGQEDEGPWA